MIKKTLYFGNPGYLSTRDRQLVFKPEDSNAIHIPIEDVGVIVLDHFGLTISSVLMERCLDQNVAIVTCDKSHLPQGLFLNLRGHHTHNEKFRAQLNASKPLMKSIWKRTVVSKIKNQGAILESEELEADNLKFWASKVKSGDSENLEARAAADYWKRVFSNYYSGFTRDRYGEAPNNLLNYGYAILRAVVARSLVAAGLLPVWGIHHRNKYNAYCLADDVMEPYRPFVDFCVLRIVEDETDVWNLTKSIKSKLLKIPQLNVRINGNDSPLMVGVQKTCFSLARCFESNSDNVDYPEFV